MIVSATRIYPCRCSVIQHFKKHKIFRGSSGPRQRSGFVEQPERPADPVQRERPLVPHWRVSGRVWRTVDKIEITFSHKNTFLQRSAAKPLQQPNGYFEFKGSHPFGNEATDNVRRSICCFFDVGLPPHPPWLGNVHSFFMCCERMASRKAKDCIILISITISITTEMNTSAEFICRTPFCQIILWSLFVF